MEKAIKLDLPKNEKWVLIAICSFHSLKQPCPFASYETLADRAGLSRRAVYDAIEKLQRRGLISVDSRRGRVSNTYQLHLEQCRPCTVNRAPDASLNSPNSAQIASQPCKTDAPTVHPVHPNKVINKASNKGLQKSRTRASNAPDVFEITESLRDWSERNAPGIDLQTETERFLDYHRAKGNQFKDWPAAWRNWMRKAVEFYRSKSAPTRDEVTPDLYEVVS